MNEGAGAAAPQAPAKKPRVTRLLPWLRPVLTVLTFAVIGFYLHGRPRPDLSAFAWRWDRFALALLCLPVLILLRASKWRLLLRGPAPGATLGQALRSYLGALSLGMVTPGRVGEYSRGLYLPQAEVQGWRGAGLVLLDNWIDFLAVLAWACIGLAHSLGAQGAALGLVLVFIFAPIPFWLRWAERVTSQLPGLWGLRESVRGALASGSGIAPGRLLRAFAVSALAYGFEWLQAALLLGFLAHTPVAIGKLAGIMAQVALANTFQVTLAGLGVREGLAMLLLSREGVGSEAAVSAAFLQTALNLFLPALIGLVFKPSALGNAGVTQAGA